MESLQAQKFAAKRWMARQQVRLLAQAEEVNEERKVIGELIKGELVELEAIYS